MAEGSVGKERRGREGNCIESFPAVDATAAAAGGWRLAAGGWRCLEELES